MESFILNWSLMALTFVILCFNYPTRNVSWSDVAGTQFRYQIYPTHLNPFIGHFLIPNVYIYIYPVTFHGHVLKPNLPVLWACADTQHTEAWSDTKCAQHTEICFCLLGCWGMLLHCLNQIVHNVRMITIKSSEFALKIYETQNWSF